MIYHRSQLTSSNGHVTGIDSPIPSSPPVAKANRHDAYVQRLVDGGLEAIEAEEARLLENRKQADNIYAFEGIDIGLDLCQRARTILRDKNPQG
ncbi:MAG: hypothetical protein EAZ74_00440 [Alphaproteobacteria bacterium]|nr:MAG: hypothetical protein EAY76_04415 [Alphaproteobacteria bacterium]TAF16017.1 MAG: hypothetical protein EAZ74_00440 [Alphaproteobacteria bacterium]TAF76210.1 MAG: hypothetical protein EAZ52_04750 [Alphaproteobacteria bacterium]